MEKEDDEDVLLEEDSYTQASVQLMRTWRPDKIVRPHFKIGASRVDFESELAGVLTFEDDIGFTLVHLFDEGFRLSNLTAGVMLKF